MLKDYYHLRLPDLNKKNDIQMEVNWNLKDGELADCKVVKFIFPDKSEAYIKREDLNFFLFAIGKPEDQQKMIPQKLQKVRWYETVLKVKATKDIRKGEEIIFPIKITLPAQEENKIGSLKEKKVGSGLIIPK
jgi:hypothetical protein